MNFQAKRIKKTATIQLVKPPQIVFPLLCPTRELDWLPGWEYEMVFSKSGYNEEGCIFITKTLEVETIWTTVKHDPGNWIIEFLNVAPGYFVFKFNISLAQTGDGGTECKIEQFFTGISEAGNLLVEQDQRGDFQEYMSGLEQMLNHYLITGQKMALSKGSV